MQKICWLLYFKKQNKEREEKAGGEGKTTRGSDSDVTNDASAGRKRPNGATG